MFFSITSIHGPSLTGPNVLRLQENRAPTTVVRENGGANRVARRWGVVCMFILDIYVYVCMYRTQGVTNGRSRQDNRDNYVKEFFHFDYVLFDIIAQNKIELSNSNLCLKMNYVNIPVNINLLHRSISSTK